MPQPSSASCVVKKREREREREREQDKEFHSQDITIEHSSQPPALLPLKLKDSVVEEPLSLTPGGSLEVNAVSLPKQRRTSPHFWRCTP